MSARMPGSSAPKGSSSSRIFGRTISDWAMRQALLHAAGEFVRISVAGACRAPRHRASRSARSRAARRRGTEQPAEQPRLAELQAEHHILHHRQVRKHRIALEHDAALRTRLVRQGLAVEQQMCPREGCSAPSSMLAGTWSCRSPRRRRWCRTRVPRPSRLRRSSTTCSPYSFHTLRDAQHAHRARAVSARKPREHAPR